MNKPLYFGRSIPELSKMFMYGFWQDYVKPNMVKKQLCVTWIQKVSFNKEKTNNIYKDIAEDLETRFDISNMNQIDHWLKEKN